jgi:hypothetical protein
MSTTDCPNGEIQTTVNQLLKAKKRPSIARVEIDLDINRSSGVKVLMKSPRGLADYNSISYNSTA